MTDFKQLYDIAITALEDLHRQLLRRNDEIFDEADPRADAGEVSDELNQLWDDFDALEYEAGVVKNLLEELDEISPS